MKTLLVLILFPSLAWAGIQVGGSVSRVFDVKTYGAVGDGTTDDTTAIAAANTAKEAAGGGVLYFSGRNTTYKVTAGFTFTKPTVVRGDGGGRTTPLTTISFNTTSGKLFTVSSDNCRFENIQLLNPNASPTSGNRGIYVTSSSESVYRDLTIKGFYINFDHQDGVQCVWNNVTFSEPVLYDLQITNVSSPDGGDHAIINCAFLSSARNASAAVHVFDCSGVRISNSKVNSATPNYLTTGIEFIASVTTADFFVTGCSIEGWGKSGGKGISVTTTGTGAIANVVIVANNISSLIGGATPTGSALYINSAVSNNINNVTVDNNAAFSSPTNTGTAYSLNGVAVGNSVFGIGNVAQNFAGFLTGYTWLYNTANVWAANQTLALNQAAETSWTISNTNSGGKPALELVNDTGGISFGMYGSTHAAYGAIPASGGFLYAGGGIPVTIMSDTAGYINFASGGSAEVGRFTATGGFVVGASGTSDPGSHNATITGSATIGAGATIGVGGSHFANVRHGISGAMTAGAVTVTDAGCTANTRYFFTAHTLGTVTVPQSYYASTRTASTSFVITSSSASDTSTVDWMAVEP